MVHTKMKVLIYTYVASINYRLVSMFTIFDKLKECTLINIYVNKSLSETCLPYKVIMSLIQEDLNKTA